MDKLGNSWAAHNPAFSEIWFAIPEGTDEHPQIAYAFNYRDNNWSIRDLERPFRHAHFGVTPQVSETTWNAAEDTWDTLREAWAMSSDAPFNANLLGVTGEEVHDIDVLNETFSDDFTSLDGKVGRPSVALGKRRASTGTASTLVSTTSVARRLYVEQICPLAGQRTAPRSPSSFRWWRALRLYRSA